MKKILFIKLGTVSAGIDVAISSAIEKIGVMDEDCDFIYENAQPQIEHTQ
jgi:hypothetical protein